VHLLVDLGTGSVAVDEWQTLTSLAVLVAVADGSSAFGSENRLTSVLADVGAARSAPDGDALLPPTLLADLAADAARADGQPLDVAWGEGFAGMLAFAGTKGWIEDDGAIRAHVEWRK
jgi:hypothetical protein